MEMNAAVEMIYHERYQQIQLNAKNRVQAIQANFVAILGVFLLTVGGSIV